MEIKKICLGAVFISALLLSGCDVDELKVPEQASAEQKPAAQDSQEQNNQQEANQEAEEPASEQSDQSIELETSIKTLDGETISIKGTQEGFIVEGYEGKIVIFEVFAWWCSDCKATVPVLNSIQAKYGEDLVVIALENEGISEDELRDYVNSNAVEYKTAAKANTGSLMPYAKNKGNWRGEVPFILVVDGSGILYRSMSGTNEITESSLDEVISDLLQRFCPTLLLSQVLVFSETETLGHL